jgi:uncharacterized protein YcbX
MIVGTVRELWRYPVKSMQGERCAELALDDHGFAGDRRWAVVDHASGKTLTAKTVPELLFAGARTHDGSVVITLPDGRELDASDGPTSAVIAAWLDRDCALVRADTVAETSYDMTFEPTNDAAELVSIPVSSGTFFDLTPVHVLTTTSLATMQVAHPDGAWDTRRFRPNVLIDVANGDAAAHVPAEPVPPGVAHPSFPEDGWVNRTIRFGNDVEGDTGAASVSVVMATVRCAMPNRAQPGLARDIDIFRTMNAHHGNHLGVYCAPSSGGLVRTGDDVHVQG